MESKNVVFTYKNINHVAKIPEEYENEDDHKAAVIEKYRKLEGKPDKNVVTIQVPDKTVFEEEDDGVKLGTGIVIQEADKNMVYGEDLTVPSKLTYRVVSGKGNAWFNVVNAEGKQVNDKPMRKTEALAYVDKLNSEA